MLYENISKRFNDFLAKEFVAEYFYPKDTILELDMEQLNIDIKTALSHAFEQAGYVATLSNKRLLTGQEVEALYSVSASSLEKMRCNGEGSDFIQFKQRGTVYYTHKSLEEWINKNSFRFCGKKIN